MKSDSSPALQPSDSYRDATNIDLFLGGQQLILNQIKSCSELVNQALTDGSYTVSGINFLGYTTAKAVFGETVSDGFLVYTHVESSGSVKISDGIYWFEQDGSGGLNAPITVCETTGKVGSVDLNFSMPSSIDSLFTEFGPTKYVYFSDNTNVVRRIVMDKTKWPILARDMSIVSRASSGMGISQLNISIGSDGNLLAGTYQFAYRLRNSSSLTTTKWSKFTNPTPVIPQTYVSGTSLNYYGGPVGSETDSSITIKIPISSGETSGTFQLIDVAVVKNNDGTNVQQGTAYVFSVSNSSGATTGYSVKYDGNQSEYELSIDSIVAAESPIETAKTIAEKDSRLLAGNIKYFDRRINDAEAKIIEARTIRKAIDYENPENCSKYVSYFRDEVYRFGIS